MQFVFATKYQGNLQSICSDVNFVRELYNYCMHAVASQSIYIKGNTFQMKAEISDKFFSASPWPLVNLGQLYKLVFFYHSLPFACATFYRFLPYSVLTLNF